MNRPPRARIGPPQDNGPGYYVVLSRILQVNFAEFF
jgi:hypothetical protein